MTAMSDKDKGLILNIFDHCDRIENAHKRFGDKFETFIDDPDYKDVIMMNLFQIGESVNFISDKLKLEIDDIPWHRIYGIRNIIAHAYIKVDEEIIWETSKNDIPELKKRLEGIV